MGEAALLQLVDLIYNAVANPDGWTIFLQSLSDAFRGHAAALFTQDFQTNIVPFLISVRSDPGFMQSYQDHFSSLNIWMKVEDKLPAGRGVTDQMLASDSELHRSEFYNDWLRPQALRHAIGGVIMRQNNLVSKISVLRPPQVGPYGEDELAQYKMLVPHLRRALDVQSRIGTAVNIMQAAESAFEHVPSGVIMLDAAGDTIFANRAAESICAEQDGLAISKAGVRAARWSEDAQLQRLIGDAIATTVDNGMGAGGIMVIPRRSGKKGYRVIVSPVSRTVYVTPLRRPAVMIFVTDPHRTTLTPLKALRDLYSLTSAEARLLAALVEGKTLREYAERRHVTMSTVRTQLAHIFSKTGTSRQAELMRTCMADLVLPRRQV